MRSGDRLTIHVTLRRDTAEQLPRQLSSQLSDAIRRGMLRPGARLPSTRGLAGQLGVSRGVVLTAYELLLAQGYVKGRPGSGTYVCAVNTVARPPRRLAAPAYGPPAGSDGPAPVGAFPIAAWRAAWRGASYRPPVEEPDPFGSMALREAVAEHLHDTRGLQVDPGAIAVTGGVRQACWLLLEAIARADGAAPGVAVEQPAPPYPVLAARQAGARVVALPVDGDGARVDDLPAEVRCAIVYAEGNPACGTVLSPARRLALLDWADRRDGYVVDVRTERSSCAAGLPLPPLANDERVALIGTVGDALTQPGLTYLVPPRRLAPLVAALARDDDGGVDTTTQQAYTRLLRDGTLARRAARVARQYARRREHLRAVCAALPRPARPLVCQRGPMVTVLLPRQIVNPVVVELAGIGMRATPLHELYQVDPATAPGGIVLDIGHRPVAQLARDVRALHAVMARLG
jgi:GntR family transcriptional regulator/MocR family aminotransferase